MLNHLADKRQISLILRLVISEDDQLLHGEIVELEGQVIGRFTEWPKLVDGLQTWLAEQGHNLADQ